MILLHSVSSLSLNRSFRFRYEVVPSESIEYILKAILLSSVKPLCFLLLNFVVLLILVYCFYEFFTNFFKTIPNNFVLF